MKTNQMQPDKKKKLKKEGATITEPKSKADLLNTSFYFAFSSQIPMKLCGL